MKNNTLYFFFKLTQLSNFKTYKRATLKSFLAFFFFFIGSNLFAQKDLIIKKDSTKIRCKILKETNTKYKYAFIDSKNKLKKTAILKSVVDTVLFNKFKTDLVENELFSEKKSAEITEEAPAKAFQFTFGIGLNVSNILEYNSPTGTDKKNFSTTSAIDLGLDYYKEGNRFAMTNELHWTLSLQKAVVNSTNHLQRVADDLNMLHDFSFAMSKNNHWNFNLIVKSNTSIITIFDEGYFKDYSGNGKVQGFLNPYEVTLSPGIKYQPNDYFRVSISPYSMSLYGLTDQKIANTGFYTVTYDDNNDYDRFVFKKLGAEINIWYDRKFKKWLEMQYRLGISSDYFSNIAKNGLMNGLFITKIKIIKNISLMHRGVLKGNFTEKPFKPYYLQTILLSYSKSF